MKLIQPCCAHRQLTELRDALKNGGTTEIEGYGDLSLTEILPALLTRYDETEMMIVAPTLPEQATDVISRWMNRQWPRRDGTGKLDVVRHLTIISDLRKEKSPVASQWKKANPFGDRLTLIHRVQEDTVILLPDFAITGPVNLRYDKHFTATATSDSATVEGLWRKYQSAEEKSLE